MTQKIFDTDNSEDMALLWSILPDMVNRIEKEETDDKLNPYHRYMADNFYLGGCCYINIDFHDKTEITRPIQEATEADIGKICAFWDGDNEDYSKQIGLLTRIKTENSIFNYVLAESVCFAHCRRLTEQEIKELC